MLFRVRPRKAGRDVHLWPISEANLYSPGLANAQNTNIAKSFNYIRPKSSVSCSPPSAGVRSRLNTRYNNTRIARASTSASNERPAVLSAPVLDMSDIMEDPEFIKQNLRDRHWPLDSSIVDLVFASENKAALLRKESNFLRERRNKLSERASGKGKGKLSAATENERERDKEDDIRRTEEARTVKASLKAVDSELTLLMSEISDLVLQLPNTSHPHSPVGDESHARIVRTLGPPVPSSSKSKLPDYDRDHVRTSSQSNLAWTNFPSSALIAGSSWPILTNEAALLELALTNYAMSVALKHGFEPVLTSDVIRHEIAERCGFAPRDKDAQQTYFLSDGLHSNSENSESSRKLCLAGTAEIPLIAMSASTTYQSHQLPLKRVGLGRAFRAEAGATGAEARGLYRVHQFSKVEMVVICSQEDSDRILEELRAIQEEILGGLGLSLRVLDMPTQELGATAHRKYDIEAWMPGRGKWGELSSASNCTSYQSRRLNIRYRPPAYDRLARAPLETLNLPLPAALEATALYPSTTGLNRSGAVKSVFAHTLNATAAAIPRLIVAILENGVVLNKKTKVPEKVRVPGVLKKFWLCDLSEKIEWTAPGEPLYCES